METAILSNYSDEKPVILHKRQKTHFVIFQKA